MQIIQLPRLLYTVITEPVEVHNTALCFIKRIAIVSNTIKQRIKLLLGTVPFKRFRKFDQNCMTAILKSKIKYSIVAQRRLIN